MIDLKLVFKQLYFPISWIFAAIYYFPITIYNLLRRHQFSTLLSISAFKNVWFATMWKYYGPRAKVFVSPVVKPLISLAHGIVLDVGPGSGDWLDLFDKTRVTKIYGIEPNRDHHVMLRQRIIEAGLSDVYFIVPAGVEDLDGKGLYGGDAMDGGWVQKGEVDCIVTIMTLCSVPQPREMINGLYGYLKKGGIWIVVEHVAMKRGWRVLKWYQHLLDVVYPQFMDGCSLTRDTDKWLKEAGSWTKIELEQPAHEPSYQIVPHEVGVLTK